MPSCGTDDVQINGPDVRVRLPLTYFEYKQKNLHLCSQHVG